MNRPQKVPLQDHEGKLQFFPKCHLAGSDNVSRIVLQKVRAQEVWRASHQGFKIQISSHRELGSQSGFSFFLGGGSGFRGLGFRGHRV